MRPGLTESQLQAAEQWNEQCNKREIEIRQQREAEINQLRADLERVTKERDEAKQQNEHFIRSLNDQHRVSDNAIESLGKVVAIKDKALADLAAARTRLQKIRELAEGILQTDHGWCLLAREIVKLCNV